MIQRKLWAEYQRRQEGAGPRRETISLSPGQKRSWTVLRFCGSLLLVFVLSLAYTAIFIEYMGWKEKIGRLEWIHLIFVALALFFAFLFGVSMRYVAAGRPGRRPVLGAFLVYVVAPVAAGFFAVVGFYVAALFIFFTFYARGYN